MWAFADVSFPFVDADISQLKFSDVFGQKINRRKNKSRN